VSSSPGSSADFAEAEDVSEDDDDLFWADETIDTPVSCHRCNAPAASVMKVTSKNYASVISCCIGFNGDEIKIAAGQCSIELLYP
jgi:hypothetical protein